MPARSMMHRTMLIVAVVVRTGLRHAVVPAPARSAAPMTASDGMLSMLGAQPCHADKIDDEAYAHREPRTNRCVAALYLFTYVLMSRFNVSHPRV